MTSEDIDSKTASSLGLCATCRFLRVQDTRRGAIFYRCERADEDDRFLKYPPLPVSRCAGHETKPRDAN